MASIVETIHTPEELQTITDRPTPELIDGQFVEREPMGQAADAVAMIIGSLLMAFARTTLPGVVNGSEGGYQIFHDDPKKVRFPDVSFTRRERLPDGKPVPGHSTIAPDLVVEVVSPNDNANKLRIKIRDFLDAGVPLIWVVNPDTRDVEVFRGDGTGGLLKQGDTLDGGDALPGFACPVASLFDV